MTEFNCSSEFGPDETITADSPEAAAELYAEDHVEMNVDDPPDRVYVTVDDVDIPVDITTVHHFNSGVEL